MARGKLCRKEREGKKGRGGERPEGWEMEEPPSYCGHHELKGPPDPRGGMEMAAVQLSRGRTGCSGEKAQNFLSCSLHLQVLSFCSLPICAWLPARRLCRGF